MSPLKPAWSSPEPLSDLALHADWDSVASMIAALRIYWFEHGTVPTWNFFFCGGRPELSVPFSWAYTWPGFFAYAFEPNHAIVAVWGVMSIVGFLAMYGLLASWTGHRFSAAVGAGIYVCSGVFATAFHRGHMPWAFYHLIPVLMLLLERNFARELRGQRNTGSLALMTLVSFLFFSGGLPHGLFYFYPAFFLLFVIRFVDAALSTTFRRAAAALTPVACAHAAGLWLAMYKLWPVMRWQAESPRVGVPVEASTIVRVLRDTVLWNVSEPFTAISFVGIGTWLLALYALYRMAADLRPRVRPAGSPIRSVYAVFALLVLICGLLLSLGNDSALKPAHWFRYVPFLNGIRGLIRYQILTVFGVSVLASLGIASIASAELGTRRRRAAAVAVGLAVVALPLAHAVLLVGGIPARPIAEIRALYPVDGTTRLPEMVSTLGRRWRGFTRPPGPDHAVAALEQGYWIATCRSDLTLPHRYVRNRGHAAHFPSSSSWTVIPSRERVPISEPPPTRLVQLTRNAITLEYPRELTGPVRLNLPALRGFHFNVATEWLDSAHVTFRAEDLHDGRLVVTATYPGPKRGMVMSLVGLLATGIFYLSISRRS